MEIQVITIHSSNADFQQIEALRRNRKKRSQMGMFFVEGVRPIEQAILHEWHVKALLYSREKRLSDWAEGVIRRAGAERLYELPIALMDELSQKEDASELIALVEIPSNNLERIPLCPDLLVVILDRPSSPGNLGTLIRSCDALGVHGLVLTGHAVDLYDPETVRATTGSFFSLPGVVLPSHHELLPWLESLRSRVQGLQVVGTSAKADTPIDEHDFKTPTILLIGNETRGLSEAYRSLCDKIVTIPMAGSATSLNIACATSILLYEISRQRNRLSAG